jgi:acyl-homoserine-lactone acylase
MLISQKRGKHMEISYHLCQKTNLIIILSTTLFITGCYKDPVTFDDDGVLEVTITRTEFGVPHVEADNLESLGFGVGYAYAEDNLCLLADQIIKYNSQRARYFGSDQNPEVGDSLNLINDFSYKALEIRAQAEVGFPKMSERVRAMLSGYTKGYNHYLKITPVDQQDPQCAGQPWLQPIEEVDLVTYALGVALLPGAGQFLAPMFIAAPPGESYAPELAVASKPGKEQGIALVDLKQVRIPEKNPIDLGSNGWALGMDRTESQRGMLLANPHFAHTGNLRFWQFHTTIPGAMDVMGASLAGMPGIVNIGFTREMAWTHTVSTAQHFIVYNLSLDESDPTGMTYVVDGQHKQIKRQTLSVDVLVKGAILPFRKDVFYSDFGPIIVIPELLLWGTDDSGRYSAYSIKDANRNNLDLFEFWMAVNLARDMDDFKQAFKDYDGVIFNNTVAVDQNGNTFFIDDSTVPYLADEAEAALTTDPSLIALRKQTGLVILPGHSSVFDFTNTVPFHKAPKLERNDFVQNSNDSYWLTNPAEPMVGYSTLYAEAGQQSLRSRMGQRLLLEAAGEDQRFSLEELEQALLSNRSYFGEMVLDDLLELCRSQGETSIVSEGKDVRLEAGCQALAQWDGTMNLDSRGAHLFRLFAEAFQRHPLWANDFDPTDPLNTPNTLANDPAVLEHLAWAISKAHAIGLPLDASLGEVQFVERSRLDGTPTGTKLPWAGANDIEGGFNIFESNLGNDGTVLPRHSYAPLPDSQLSAEAGGYHVTSGSSWMFVMEYTDSGLKAKGLMCYSQATNPASPYFLDQTEYYSEQPRLRPIWFEKHDIDKHTQSSKKLVKKLH